MQGIVSDTTPLNYLVLIQAIDIVPRLYERVFIPVAVRAELTASEAPASVREWISSHPLWLEVLPCSKTADADLARLDPWRTRSDLAGLRVGGKPFVNGRA